MYIQEDGTVLSNIKISETYYDMTVYSPKIAGCAKPGQFVNIKCGDDLLLRRPISICDCDGENFRLVYENRGAGTSMLTRLITGDNLDILGPLGNGVFPTSVSRVLLVGGGCGAAPLLFAAKKNNECSAVLGFRTCKNAVLTDDFYSVCENLLIATDDGTMGASGTVERPVNLLLEKHKFSYIFACGPRPMLKAVSIIAKRHSIPCYVSTEERMACGVGACLCCAIKTKSDKEAYSHVCKDGPVFEAGQIVLED